MSDPSTRQRRPRHPIQLSLLYRSKCPAPTRAGVGWTRNLSEGGASVELAESLQPSTPLQVLFQTDRSSIEVEARVVWTGEQGSTGGGILHGVAFTRIAPYQQEALRDLLRSSQGQRRHAGVRLPAEISIMWRRKGQAGPLFQGRAGDISRAGLLLRLPQALPAGTVLEITLHIANEPVTAEGTIVWVDPSTERRSGEPIRHGFRFTALGWTSALAMALFLAAVP